MKMRKIKQREIDVWSLAGVMSSLVTSRSTRKGGKRKRKRKQKNPLTPGFGFSNTTTMIKILFLIYYSKCYILSLIKHLFIIFFVK